jgi:hypothetical protein
MTKMPKVLWIAAVGLLLLATMKLPYGYYTFLRISIFGFCAALAFFSLSEKSYGWGTIFLLIAVLFNPITPVYLRRPTWFWLDVGAAAIIALHLGYITMADRRSNLRPRAN